MRRHHILIVILALLVGACTDTASDPTITTGTLIVTTTSTLPPTTSVVAPPPATLTIEVWTPQHLVEHVQQAATAFEIGTSIRVEVTAIEADAALESILADPASGPDVFIGPHAWLSALTYAGVVEPVTARSDVVAGALAAVTLRGVTFGAPLALDTIVQFRNTDALAVAPATIETLAEGCPRGDETIACLLLATDSVEGHYPFIAGLGGYIFGPDEFEGWAADDVGVGTAEALAGGLILQSIVDGAGFAGDGNSTAEERFIDGTAPLLWGDAASLAILQLGGVTFVVEQLPTIGEAPAPTPVRVTAAWVNAFSPGKEVALAFVSDYLAAPSSANQIALGLGMAPVNIGFDADQDLVPFIESAKTGHPIPTIFQTDYAWEQLAIAFDDIRTGDDSTSTLESAAQAIRNAPEPELPGETEDG
jgi:maltose-binding protein MalE